MREISSCKLFITPFCQERITLDFLSDAGGEVIYLDAKAENRILEEIKQTLDDVKAILLLLSQDRLVAAKKSLLPVDSLKARIYEMCDGTNTTKSIAQALGKDEASVRGRLSDLRRDGLVRSVERNGDQVHEQRF